MLDLQQSFWDFSVNLYSRDDVAPSCLCLQDSYGLDVNLLLYCCWHGSYFGVCDEAVLDSALAFSQQWRKAVVQPLRTTRQWLKQQQLVQGEEGKLELSTLRERVKEDELSAEKIQQDQLQAISLASRSAIPVHEADVIAAIEINFTKLLQRCAVTPDKQLQQKLQLIITAVKLSR